MPELIERWYKLYSALDERTIYGIEVEQGYILNTLEGNINIQTKETTQSFNPLLPLLSIRIPCRTKTALMSRDKASDHFILSHIADCFVVAFCGPGSRVEFGPVYLVVLLVVEDERGWMGGLRRACRCCR